jgi:2-methylcitrate dehydratase PrpD
MRLRRRLDAICIGLMGDIKSTASLTEAVTWLARSATLPAEVEAKARLLLLDTLGCLIAGLRHPEVGQFAQALCVAFPGAAAWPASDVALAPAGLAALGAAAACWDEACEGNAAAHGRPGLPVVPALLALATTRDVSLGELLHALVTGYEIGARAGEVWRIPHGWHVDGGWHSLGVAAAVARMTAGPELVPSDRRRLGGAQHLSRPCGAARHPGGGRSGCRLRHAARRAR